MLTAIAESESVATGAAERVQSDISTFIAEAEAVATGAAVRAKSGRGIDEASDAAETLSTVDTIGLHSDQSELVDADLKDLQPADVAAWLEPYGYPAQDAMFWLRNALPVARFRIRIHTEMQGHTMYLVECSLTPPGMQGPALTWSAMMRLQQLRKRIHDHVKRELGADYSKHFEATPFAHHLGPPGTTGRLHAWFHVLSVCMTAGVLKPGLVAHVLRALDMPKAPRKGPTAQEEEVSTQQSA
mmetsp:Transcript_139131/g.242086  ORF Transcript_139131/g.242086 Transcript_139131/m.242086 type:complete len:243 (-) Transcript_139131:33-761(-)